MKENPEAIIESEVLEVQTQQRELQELQMTLAQNPEFARFVELTRAVNDKMAEVRKKIEDVMIPAYQAGKVDKSIKGDWGSVTVTEGDKFEINEKKLDESFFKTVVDEARIRATFQLEGKAPKGTKHFKKYGIMMKLK